MCCIVCVCVCVRALEYVRDVIVVFFAYGFYRRCTLGQAD